MNEFLHIGFDSYVNFTVIDKKNENNRVNFDNIKVWLTKAEKKKIKEEVVKYKIKNFFKVA